MTKCILTCCLMICSLMVSAQTFRHYTTTEQKEWQSTSAKLHAKAAATPLLIVTGQEKGHEFKAWGTCFNELGLDALLLLTDEAREEILHNIFAPDGQLHFTRGRLTMNANDYSRAWYSCDTVAGDFMLKYFNIEHDKKNVIRLIKMAQKYQPALTFWMSPWSPPAWMKINQDYPVVSSRYNNQPKEKDVLLYDGVANIDPDEMKLLGNRNNVFPRCLATQNFMIQDPRYLQSYADMFCRFIELYAEQDIPIDMVMYQNEAYSYNGAAISSYSDSNKLRYGLVGDPAMRLAYPSYEVRLETINDIPVSETNMPDFKARQTLTLKGSIYDSDGTKATAFNGTITPTLYDAEQSVVTNGNQAVNEKEEIEKYACH